MPGPGENCAIVSLVGSTAAAQRGCFAQNMVLAGLVSSVTRGVLSRVQIPVNLQHSGLQAVGAAGSLSIWRGFAKGTYLDKNEVTDRVLNVVKHFEKVDENKVYPHQTQSVEDQLAQDRRLKG